METAKLTVGQENEEETIPAVNGEGGEEEGGEEEEDDANPFRPPEKIRDYPLWLLSLPWYCVFTITIPDCSKVCASLQHVTRAFWTQATPDAFHVLTSFQSANNGSCRVSLQPRWDKWYLVSFVMSIAWIGLISWYMVEWCVAIGCILKIPLSVMGVTVLAAGTSIPDALSSIVVAKQGQGNMAVANAIGSNVFDIWLGLGLPWWIILLIDFIRSDVAGLCVSTKELLPNIIVLFSVLIFYFGLLVIFRFRLYVKIGIAFMLLYAVFAVWQVVGVWRFDVYNLAVPGVSECLCHIDVSHGVTTSCYNAANGLHVAEDHAEYGVGQYDEWWAANKDSEVAAHNPANWVIIGETH